MVFRFRIERSMLSSNRKRTGERKVSTTCGESRLDAHRNDAQYYAIQYQRDGVTTIDLHQPGGTSCPRLAAHRCCAGLRLSGNSLEHFHEQCGLASLNGSAAKSEVGL